MFQYIVKRLLLMAVTLFGIAVVTFVLTRLTPGDPAAMRVQGSAGGGSQAVGGYDDLVELNRRNLGLDKPLILNLHFEDRVYAANRALRDYLRPAPFWQKDGERRLGRVTTIALAPALDLYARIQAGEAVVQINDDGEAKAALSPEEQKKRLAAILSRLAADSSVQEPRGDSDDVYTFWKNWYEENRTRFAEERVEELVRKYLAVVDPAEVDRLGAEILRAGGFSVPYLAGQIDSDDLETQRRVNWALQAQTGFTFVVEEDQFADRAETVMGRWRSWWRREQGSYVDYSGIGDLVNILCNTQFGLWVSQAIFFDFGDSYVKRRPVSELIGEALPVSLLLSGLSILLSYLISIPLGVYSAVKRYTPGDRVATVILFVLYSLPSFWVAGILLLTLTGPPFLNLFPTRGLNSTGISRGAEGVGDWQWLTDRVWHLVLPVLCLSYTSLAFLSRQMRSAMLETINQDFIRTARAKGLPGHVVIFKHALRNSLIPILTISAGLLPELIAGAVIIESIFTIPGMGTLTFEAIVNRDYPIINAVLFFSAFLTLLGILLADLSYALVDPRIKFE